MSRKRQRRSKAQQRLFDIGLARVAVWCGVSESAVYKWVDRRPSDSPVPPQHIPAILIGCRQAGIELEAHDLWAAATSLRELAA